MIPDEHSIVRPLFQIPVNQGRATLNRVKVLDRGYTFKGRGGHMVMNIFISENIGNGVTFKNVISWTFESRFH